MSDAVPEIIKFGNFSLDSAERLLYDRAKPVQLSPKVFDTLLLLIRNSGHVVSKEKMLAEIWEDSFVEENNLAQNISVLRRILSESSDSKLIETVPKFGYRFVGVVSSEKKNMPAFNSQTARSDANLPHIETPETRYVRNGDVNIAYQVIGDGPIDIVFVMGWVSHLEYFWKHPLFASFLARLASFSRLILFDKRGTGLSDRVPLNELPTLEQRMEDVHAVMDAVGSMRAALVGVSEGGPMCSLFAATYPERTAALVMIGTYAKRIRDKDYPWAPTNEERETFFEIMQREWGRPVGIEERAPSMAGDVQFRDWWATYLRMGASPGAAVALTKMNAEIDVRNVLPSIRVPTLVIHRAGDLCLKVEEGRFVASKIPGSKYVELKGVDHLPFVGDQDEILDPIEAFLADVRDAEAFDRVLATVVNIRLVYGEGMRSRTEVAEQMDLFISRQLEMFKGREAKYGDGETLATFDGPARAIRCAAAISAAAERFGVEVKTGVHTGECDVAGDVYSGFAIDLARLVAAECRPGTVLASRTVKDLVAGSGLIFEEFGTRTFEGVEGQWPLYIVAT